MARLDRLFIGGDGDIIVEAIEAFGLGLVEQVKQGIGIGDLEIPFRHLAFVFEEHVAVSYASFASYRFAA